MRTVLLPIAGLVAAALLGACAHHHEQPCTTDAALPPKWRLLATENDRGRVRDWRKAWLAALDKARKAGRGGDIAREGDLLVPDLMLSDPIPPAGNYLCRTVKVGAKWSSVPDYISYPPEHCRIWQREDGLRLATLDGVQRPRGMIYTDNGERGIFLGTMVLGDEHKSIAYNIDADRDMVGIIQRVGDRKWRIAFPYPHWESTLDVMELTPGDQAS